MSLTFVIGLPGSGKTTLCLDAIIKCLNEKDIKDIKDIRDIKNQQDHSSSLYYIVPEQSSLQAERMLVAKSKSHAVMGAQALSFGRLAYHVFARVGGAPTKHLNDTGKHMLLRKVLQECELSFYARAMNMPGFIENLSQTVTEFSQYLITPHDLEKWSVLSETKLKDLAVIYRRYLESISGRFLVTGETLDILASSIAPNYFKNSLFWIDGFKDFTPAELRVIGQIMAQAQDVTVTLTMDVKNSMRNSPGSAAAKSALDFFYDTKNTMQRLTEIAQTLGIHVNQPIILSELHRHSNDMVNHYNLKRLTKFFPNPAESEPERKFHDIVKSTRNSPGIHILSLQDKSAELTQAAEWIYRNVVKEKRWKFSDIAVLCGDLPGYEKLAHNIFAPYGIPLFVDSKMGVLSHPLTELIRAAVDIVAWDWQYEGVFRLLKTGFAPFTMSEVDLLENYVLARGIKGWRWHVAWHDENMENLRLRALKMMEPLLLGNTSVGNTSVGNTSVGNTSVGNTSVGNASAGNVAAGKVSISDFAHRIYDWLYELDAPGTLSNLLEESTGDQEQIRWHKQIWPGIAEIFDKLVEILGSDTVSIREFSDILDSGFKSADLGMIPPSLDQVVMGDITRSRYPEIKALWVLGANDGQLPPGLSSGGQGSLITEDERSALRSTGIVLAPDLPRQISGNMLALYGALCQSKEALVLSYSRITSEGKNLRPSPVLARIKKVFPGLKESGRSGDSATPHNPSGDSQSPLEFRISQSSTQQLYGEQFTTTASRLEAFARCPFAYFMNYNLKAKERAVYQVRATDLGTLYHDVLARATMELTETDKWHTADRNYLENMVHSLAESVTQNTDHVLRSSARNMYIMQRVKSICTVSLWALCEQYRRGTFQTSGIETGIDEIRIPLSANQIMNVTGRADRIDILEYGNKSYVKIIDYKSGGRPETGLMSMFGKQENVQRAMDFQKGNELQLLLYMNAMLKTRHDVQVVSDTNHLNAGGVFYFNIDDPILTVDASLTPDQIDMMMLKHFQLSGLALNDDTAISGMDTDLLQSGGESLVIPVSIKKDGTYGKNSAIATQEEFEVLCQAVEEQAKEIGSQMAAGNIMASPYRKGRGSPCRFCRFGSVCMNNVQRRS